MEAESLDVWFKRQILVHEEALVRYLTRCWPNAGEIVDLRQDTYVRVYEAAAKVRPQSPKSFLFTTARHLMTDRLRRQRIVAIDAVGDLEALNVTVEELSPEDRANAHQELRRLAEAIDDLPPRCREAVWMRRVDDLPQKEVAARLGVTQKTVEKHIMKGMQLLAEAMARSTGRAASRRPGAGQRGEASAAEKRSAHGEPDSE
jgi:RNA polymerase sigma factor (sigma-70 family)